MKLQFVIKNPMSFDIALTNVFNGGVPRTSRKICKETLKRCGGSIRRMVSHQPPPLLILTRPFAIETSDKSKAVIVIIKFCFDFELS